MRTKENSFVFTFRKTETQNIYFKLINFNFQIKKKEAISYNLLPVINRMPFPFDAQRGDMLEIQRWKKNPLIHCLGKND